MANHRKQPDSHSAHHDDAQLEQLLKSGYTAPEPSLEFQASLLRQLEQEFVKIYQPASLEVPPSMQGIASDSHADLAESQPHVAISEHRGTTALRSRQRIGLRLAMTMATAASLLLVISLWNNQSAYGWAAMLRALESCDWVQAVSETASLNSWVSSERGIVAIRSARQVAFHDHQEQTALQYYADRKIIAQQSLLTDTGTQGATKLFGLLLQDNASSSSQPQTLPHFEVVTEVWQRMPSRNGQKEMIELRVTLKVLEHSEKLVKLVFQVDPETHLPQSCWILANGREFSKPLTFTYPAEGPSSIFALGVPRETEVATSLAMFDDRQPKAARKAEDWRVLTQPKKPKKSAKQDLDQASTRLATKRVESEKVIDFKNAPSKKPAAVSAKISAGIAVGEVVVDKIIERPLPNASDEVKQADTRMASKLDRPLSELLAPPLPEQVLAPQKLIEQVNTLMAANWQAQGVTPAKPASDSEFLRRVYLDLAGRIPAHHEVYDFLAANPQDRREILVDELLASRDHATHLASVWRTMLLPDGVDTNNYGGTSKFDEWLADRFENNLPYDQLVRQLLLAEGRISDSGPILFYAALKLNPEELAAKTARIFLGMRMECAQCHDHKFDDSITQEDFWGFAAHFAQISRPLGKMDMTSSVLRVYDNGRGEVMIPDTEEVIPPRLPYVLQAAQATEASTPKRSRREILVDWLTTKQNSRFAQATVNRVWQHLFGLGLVEPVDDMRSDNPAMYPDILQLLGRDFAASGYDLRRLLRTLVLSNAYQLSSQAKVDEPSQGLTFARMNIKSFTAEQLYDCISVATEYEAMQGDGSENGTLARFGNRSRQAFIEQFRAPPGQRTDFHAGIPQALTLMHGYLIHGATDLTSSGLLKSLNAPFFTNQQRIETLFLATLSRFPEEVESNKMLEHVLAATSDLERSRALGDILWALLNSAEFSFIH